MSTSVVDAPTERCPWCQSLIVRSKFLQIQAAIADEERNKLREERVRIESRIMAEAAKKVIAVEAERDQIASSLRDLTVREAAARERAVGETETRVRAELQMALDEAASKLKDATAREAAAREQALAEAETRVRAEAQMALDATIAERDEAVSKLEDATAREAAARERAIAETEARVRGEAQNALDAVMAERDEVVSELKDTAAREAAAREQAVAAVADTETRVRAEMQKDLDAVVAERDGVASKLRESAAREAAGRQQAVVETEARVRAESLNDLGALTAQRDEAQFKLQEALTVAEQHQMALHQLRRSLEADRDTRLLEKEAERNREREQLQKKIDTLTRALQHKTPNELGDGAEINLYDTLRDTFTSDDITRIKKGQPGADIRQRVMYKGAVCGTILIDSKNRQAWQNSYISKLREDQVSDDADHAVLATTIFPAGKKELYVDAETGVVVVNRARASEVIRVLRDAMVRMHCLGLSLEQRAEKRDLLYAYITSESYRQQMTEVNRMTSDLLALDADEKRAHDKVWETRGRMTTRLRNISRSMDTELNAIIEGNATNRR